MSDTFSLDLGWFDRARVRFDLWRDQRRAARAAHRVGMLDSGELVLVDGRGRARVFDAATTAAIDNTLWVRALQDAYGAATDERGGAAEPDEPKGRARRAGRMQ